MKIDGKYRIHIREWKEGFDIYFCYDVFIPIEDTINLSFTRHEGEMLLHMNIDYSRYDEYKRKYISE